MKKIASVVMLAFLFGFSFCCLLRAQDSDEESAIKIDPTLRISLDFQDARLKDILKAFSMQAGLNFIASEAVQDRSVTLYLDNVPVKDAMDKIFKANNLTYQFDPDSNIFYVKEWGKPEVETNTQIFNLKYAHVSNSSLMQEISKGLGGSASSGITESVKNILSAHGKVIEDSRTNSLIVTDIPSRLPMIAQTVAALDIPVPQVMLEVEMLDVNKNTVEKLGVKWKTPLAKLDVTGSIVTPFPFAQSHGFEDSGEMLAPAITDGGWTGVTWPGTQFGPSILSIINSALILDFLKTQSDTKYLARPRILTMNNETAEIKITTQETIGLNQATTTGSSTTIAWTAERVETGVTLRVTPQINTETGEITMFIVPTVKDTATSAFLVNNAGSTFYKDPEERTTKATVQVKDGDTVILGGLFRKERNDTITKLPILGDIPILGALFRHRNTDKNKERELLVFITPHIIKTEAMKLAARAKGVPSGLEREQDPALGRRDAISQALDGYDTIKIIK